jgi:3-hydroxyisobutyrate dehydrogenase-like beta-hydroxyacid dehydrogenase
MRLSFGSAHALWLCDDSAYIIERSIHGGIAHIGSRQLTTAGVIGLGAIGGGVAICLVRSGHLKAVYDIRSDASDKLPGVPAVAASPAEVARQCDVVLIAVLDAKQTVTVLEGPEGVLSQARPGLNVVLLSTVSLEDLKGIRALTDAAGVGLVDSGVTGGINAARNGLVCLVGADEGIFSQVKPALEGFAKVVVHMGGPGAGMAAKIARNVIVYGSLRAGYEGVLLAKAAGVDVRKLVAAVEASSESVGGPLMLLGRDADPAMDPAERKLRESVCVLLDKDLDAALELAKSVGASLPLAELARRTDRSVMGLEP